jgi:hypothetical protein
VSVNDPIILGWSKKWGWMLHQGRETFFNENNEMRCWDTMEEARQWAIDNLGVDPLEENCPPEALERYEKAQQKKTDFTDLPLFGGSNGDN